MKPLDCCSACGEQIEFRPGETFVGSTDGRVWHYGCAPSRQRPEAVTNELIEALKAIKELAVAEKTFLCWKTANDALSKVSPLIVGGE